MSINRFKAIYEAKEREIQRLGGRLQKVDVAKALGISRAALDNWINDEITRFDTDMLKRICNYFKVPLSDLLEYTPEKENDA